MIKFKDIAISVLLIICIVCSVTAALKTGVIAGPQGIQGIQGERGEQGEQGPIGLTGPQGIQGETGEQGPQGIQGPKGDTGAQGVQGIQGPKGDTGATGPKGDKGDIGKTGATGAKGDKGDTGANGLTPYIGENGNWWIGTEDTGTLAQGTIITTESYYAMVDFEKTFTLSGSWPAMSELTDYFDFSGCGLGTYEAELVGNIKLEDTLNVTQVTYKFETEILGFKLPSGSGVTGGTKYNYKYYYGVGEIMTSGVQYRFSEDLQYVYLTYDSFVMTDIEALAGVEVTIIGQERVLICQN